MSDAERAAWMPRLKPSRVRRRHLRSSALSLLQAGSMGLKSGLYGDRKTTRASRDSMTSMSARHVHAPALR
ncbi:hypothetical protein D7W81_15735 [Corallococcus aberystwythensis]|uniref:Uncharacterized protein n=1 Tax=Corallococcus aberystwythensis TaxID=2316722 RepID=A0A3A8QN07_9BACT|nr:hypothetical protein D7W81_15735 [Corallococcus aberystwythensis]